MPRPARVDSERPRAHAADMDGAWLMLSGLFSLLGMAVFAYGRRRRTATHTLLGAALMGYPYFVSSLAALIAVGVLLLVGVVVGSRFEDG